MGDLRVPDLNKVILAGRLTRDPELKYTGSGQPYCRLGVANSRFYRDKDGNRQEATTFVDVVVWGQMAEGVAQRMTRGRAVLIEGRLQTRRWEDSEGTKHASVEIVANEMMMLGDRRDSNQNPPGEVDKFEDIQEEFPF